MNDQDILNLLRAIEFTSRQISTKLIQSNTLDIGGLDRIKETIEIIKDECVAESK